MNRVGVFGLERGVGSVCTQGALRVCTLRRGRGCPTAPTPIVEGAKAFPAVCTNSRGFGKAAGGGGSVSSGRPPLSWVPLGAWGEGRVCAPCLANCFVWLDEMVGSRPTTL